MTPREPVDWHNRMAARSLLSIPAHRPVRRACDINIPILLIVAEHDTKAPIGPALAMAERAPRAELHRSTGGHYDVYDGGVAFGDVIKWEVDFLRRHARIEPTQPQTPSDSSSTPKPQNVRGRGCPGSRGT